MFLVHDLMLMLPPGTTALEEEDFLMVKCGWCGEERKYMSRATTLDQVRDDAWGHTLNCPAADGHTASEDPG